MIKNLCAAVALLCAASATALAGTSTDRVEFLPHAAPTCTVGRSCIYGLNTDGLLYTKDANELTLKLHAAQGYRVSANCSGLASPQNGDVCYDSTIPAFRYYSGGWKSAPYDDALVVHRAGTETITGAKTFTASVTLTGGATLGANLNAGGFKILTLGTPTVSGDAVNKSYTDALRLYHFHGHADTASGSKYLGPAAYGAAASSPITLFTAPETLTVRKLVCTWDTAPGGVVADVVTVASRPSGGTWADLATSCTATGTDITCTGTSTSALAQYDSVGVQIVRNGLSVSAGYDCEVWVSL